MNNDDRMKAVKEDFKKAVKEGINIGNDNETKSMKKVLKITANKTSEFLFAYDNKSVATCKSVKDAIDITQFNFDQIAFLISNLKKVGYTTQIIEVKA
jgi:hypothetical protein